MMAAGKSKSAMGLVGRDTTTTAPFYEPFVRYL